ncbi:MAG TPA: U32 family peptidase [Clostridiales bacterium]|nr:U32 family peptidase [Clostridiales bacterium]HQP70328.1 U32 family peptidase [Clostridiales bacterium]
MKKKIELLAPAGDFDKLKTAVLYGADAVYLSGKDFGMRAYAGNFSDIELAEAKEYCSKKKVKLYVTVNIIAHNKDLKGIEKHLAFLNEIKADAAIISDLGIMEMSLKKFPDLPVHVSTQFSAMNHDTVNVLHKMGASRIILPRELSAAEIKQISKNTKAELEMFVHGAMCMAYSGRCMLSYHTKGRDPNRGECNQTCRFRYDLVSADIPGGFYIEEESKKGTYFFNSRDLCLIEHIPEVAGTGVASVKIEGRMKTRGYLSTVVKTYREAIDLYYKDRSGFKTDSSWMNELKKVSNREYTTFRFNDETVPADQNYKTGKADSTHDMAGIVREIIDRKYLVVEVKSAFHKGDEIEIVIPEKRTLTVKLDEIKDVIGRDVTRTKPNQTVLIRHFKSVVPGSVIRIKK